MAPMTGKGPERFSAADKLRLSVEILCAYGLARLLLVRTSFSDAVTRMRAGRPRRTELSIDAAVQLGHVVQRALGTLPFDSRCLIRSLVLIRLLATRGANGTLVIGVATKPAFAAHAWVEWQGIVLLPTDEARFQRLGEF